MKKLLFLFLLLTCPAFFTFADDTGTGCLIGEHWVYTAYIGASQVIGQGSQQYRYYNVNGAKIPVYTGWGANLYRGYRCGYINRYDATSFWDATIPPYGDNVNIPQEQEYTKLGGQCIVSATLGGLSVPTDGQSGVGEYVYYSYNKTNKCSNPPNSLPIDDYTQLIVLNIAVIGVYFLNKKVPNLAQA